MDRLDHDAGRVGFAASAPLELQDAHCTRLLCASRWSPESSAVEALLREREAWLARHAGSGVRSALLHASGWLVQWHEGTPAAVDAEWRRLQRDAGQRERRVLHCSEGPARLAAAVQVASVHSGEGPAQVERRLRPIEHEERQGRRTDPLEVWQALSAPVHAAAGRAPGVLAHPGVLAIASEDNEGVEAVRMLSLAAGERIVYQRYAGSALGRGDVGAAYVDLPAEPGVLARVHALPRRALGAGASLLGVGEVDRVILLLGSQAERGRMVAREAVRVLQGMERMPAVVVAARCPQARDVAAQEFAGIGGLRLSRANLAGGERAAAALLWRAVRASGVPAPRACARAGTAPSPSRPPAPAA